MAESNPMRWVVVAVVAALAFTIGLRLFIDHTTETAKAKAKAETAAMVEGMEKRGTPLLDEIAAVAAPFVAHVGAGRFAQAHALLAAPYRDAVSVESFAKACRASSILAGGRAVTLLGARQQSAGEASTLEAHGVLDSQAGGVPVAFTFLKEPAGPRILTVSLAGVPVLQGVTAAK